MIFRKSFMKYMQYLSTRDDHTQDKTEQWSNIENTVDLL